MTCNKQLLPLCNLNFNFPSQCISYYLNLYLVTTSLIWPYFNVLFEGHIRQVWPWTLLLFGPLFQNIRIRIKCLSYFFYILYIVLLSNDHLWSVLNIQLFINGCHCNIFSIVKMSFTLSELFTWLNMIFLFNVSTVNNTYHLMHYNKQIYTKTFKLLSRVDENFFFLSDIGSGRNWGSVWPMAFVSVPPFFCNIVYNLSHFVFLYRTECKIIYMIIKELN